MSNVLVVLTHYKRPQNLAAQIRAFRDQSYPVDIVLVDNASQGWAWHARSSDRMLIESVVHDVYEIRRNAGPSCRFVAPFMDVDHKWTLLYDDDMLPDPGAVEHLVAVAGDEGETFCEIGSVGRRFRWDETGRPCYNRRDVKRHASHQFVDMICRAHFFKTHRISKVVELRQRLLRIETDPGEINRHDDMLMLGMKLANANPMLMANEPDGCRLIGEELSANDAMHQSDGFMAARHSMLRQLQRLKVIT